MYWNILRKDLKRKKTMNFILIVFMILSVMFVSSSVNTIISVSTAVDGFLEKSGAGNYFVATMGNSGSEHVEELLKETKSVNRFESEDILYLLENAVEYKGEKLNLSSTGLLNSADDISTKIFTKDGNELTAVQDGEIYLVNSFINGRNIEIGSKINITVQDKTKEFTVKGSFMDSLFGSAMMSSPRFIISQNDFEYLKNQELYSQLSGKMFNIFTSDTNEVEQKINEENSVMFMAGIDTIKLTYILDTIIAGVFLIVSICLIIIAFVILKFTISFTLSEEYREIGIMKAIGISNFKIRTLYMIKYFAMSALSAVIGFIAGIPFGKMMLSQASENILIESSGNLLINLLCSLAVVIFIILFCYLSTNKIKKFTPVDAIRNGETGKRYKKKGIMSLSKSPIKPVLFMAVNDILSGFRHFIIMTLTFVIGILLITILLNTMSTLKSEKLLTWFSQAECNVALEDINAVQNFSNPGGKAMRTQTIKEMEEKLNENGIPAKCFGESIFKLGAESDKYKTKSLSFQGLGITPESYVYLEGTAPINENEVALTHITANKLNVKIGDKIRITTGTEKEEYIITAIYQGMNNMGEGIRLSDKLDIDYSQALGFFSYQIKYTDNPTQQQKEERLEKIKELYPDMITRTASEYADYSIGGVSGYMNGIKNFVLLVVIIINILVVVLMEKSFLTKERSEIALMKAIGFKNNAVILWQTIRIAIVMLLSIIIAVLLSEPVSQLAVSGIFKMMGAYNIIFDIDILNSYIVYPFIVFVVTVFAVFLCVQSVRSIPTSEINNIE